MNLPDQRPVRLITSSEVVLASDVMQWLHQNPLITRLNVVGNRESTSPGIGERVERFLTAVFKRVNKQAEPIPSATRSVVKAKAPRKREEPPGCPLRGNTNHSHCFIGRVENNVNSEPAGHQVERAYCATILLVFLNIGPQSLRNSVVGSSMCALGQQTRRECLAAPGTLAYSRVATSASVPFNPARRGGGYSTVGLGTINIDSRRVLNEKRYPGTSYHSPHKPRRPPGQAGFFVSTPSCLLRMICQTLNY
jgi:hypothetical protein